jgi:hypothetical protein
VFSRSLRISDAVGVGQRVEKVVVGLVGGPKVVRNKVETLRKRRFQPLVQRLKSARRSFSTRWFVFRTALETPKTIAFTHGAVF